MEKKNAAEFRKQVGDKSLSAYFPQGTQLGEAYDFCMDMALHFAQLMKQSAEKSAQKEQKDVSSDSDQSSSGDSKDS